MQTPQCDCATCKLQNHSMEITEFYCLSFFANLPSINVLLKNFTVNQFDVKNLHGSEFLVFSHSKNFSLINQFEQKIRELNDFNKEVAKELISRNIFQ